MNILETTHGECEALRKPSYLGLVTSSVILVGLFISYLPQHYRIISRRTSEGISPYFVLLGTTSSTAGFANILTVHPSRVAIGCCKELGAFNCTAGLLGIAQIGVGWLCISLVLVLFLIFFRYRGAAVPTDELGGSPPGWRTAVSVGLVTIIYGLIVIIVTAIFATALPKSLDKWATCLGLMATVLAGFQYFPQIWTTYNLKHVGSLSIPMLCIQTPGGMLFALSLYGRLGMEGWSTWMIYVLTAVMQSTVLSMCIYYEVAARRRAKLANGHDESGLSTADQHGSHRRPIASRTYSEGWERGLPGPFTGHPERYAETEEDLDDIQDREERAIARENQPLLRPGGIGNPRRTYDGAGH